MKYVLDSSVGFKWFLIEDQTSKARSLRDDYRAALVELVAPDVFPIEIVHALTRAERTNRVTAQEGSRLVADLFQILPALHQFLLLLPRAYQISSQIRIGVYDCLYLALAEREQCDLVTADQRLLNSLKGFPVRPLSTL
ncbi:MAG TPA: type II toxin-antitoxin system VapC family toxin [Planctomycetaceae bacterium]|jgi:predicted nucleic acid-binding protein|nr:type II toxin-antitoxin system VapC family toxin [Planctomycetaceae bacterium]